MQPLLKVRGRGALVRGSQADTTTRDQPEHGVGSEAVDPKGPGHPPRFRSRGLSSWNTGRFHQAGPT